MSHFVPRFALLVLALCAQTAWADDCLFSGSRGLDKIACSDPTASRFLERLAKAQKALDRVIPLGARPALKSHQARWEMFADAWLTSSSTHASNSGSQPPAPRCSSPRALLFQRMDSLEKAVVSLKENKSKTLDLCYDNAACLEPGATNTAMICETIHLAVDNVPANLQPIALSLLNHWMAQGFTFETHITKSTRHSEPCELVTERTLVEYLRGGFATVRSRQGDTCNLLAANETIQTFNLRTGQALTISDFSTSPATLLALLKKRGEADVLQALLRNQLHGDKSRPHIEPSECAQLPFTNLNEVHVHVTSDGLRVNKLFEKTQPELAPCQFKVEESISTTTIVQLLKEARGQASGLLRYIR